MFRWLERCSGQVPLHAWILVWWMMGRFRWRSIIQMQILTKCSFSRLGSRHWLVDFVGLCSPFSLSLPITGAFDLVGGRFNVNSSPNLPPGFLAHHVSGEDIFKISTQWWWKKTFKLFQILHSVKRFWCFGSLLSLDNVEKRHLCCWFEKLLFRFKICTNKVRL